MGAPHLFVCTGIRDRDVADFLNELFVTAVRCNASDVHLEDYEAGTRVRVRVNGLLHEQCSVPKEFGHNVGTKIRARANLPLSERDTPLDGRMFLWLDGRYIDVRVSIVPTSHGESIVCRLLDQSNAGLPFEHIEMPDDVRAVLLRIMSYPDGMILASGPTGSGKTTTLYSILNKLNRPEIKMVTIEDPVEYRLPYACQITISVGTTFPKAIRAVLRQDPDIILVGEIRDGETVQTALAAAMTGHLVLSSIHANDAPTTITRLLDLMAQESRKVDPYILEVTLRGIIAQRLVRTLCEHCREETVIENGEALWLEAMGYDPRERKAYRAAGCDRCEHTGYVGRMPIIELLEITPAVRRAIKQDREEIVRCAREQPQYRPLMQSALDAVWSGRTDIKEVRRVIRDANL